MDLGEPLAYTALPKDTPVYSADGEPVGVVAHVLADEHEDVFDGIVISHSGQLGHHGHRFADADEIDRIYEHGVLLKLDHAAAEQLPEPSSNPAVMRDDPAESSADRHHEKLMRAWDLLSGNR